MILLCIGSQRYDKDDHHKLISHSWGILSPIQGKAEKKEKEEGESQYAYLPNKYADHNKHSQKFWSYNVAVNVHFSPYYTKSSS